MISRLAVLISTWALTPPAIFANLLQCLLASISAHNPLQNRQRLDYLAPEKDLHTNCKHFPRGCGHFAISVYFKVLRPTPILYIRLSSRKLRLHHHFSSLVSVFHHITSLWLLISRQSRPFNLN